MGKVQGIAERQLSIQLRHSRAAVYRCRRRTQAPLHFGLRFGYLYPMPTSATPIRRLETLDALWSLAQRVLLIVFPAGTGALSAWAAHATQTLQQFAPFSWVMAGLLGALLALWIWWLWWKAWDFRLKVRMRAALANPTALINPGDSVFQNKRIKLTEFFDPFWSRCEGKTFIDCDLIGPAVILFHGGTPEIQNAIDCDFVSVQVGKPLRHGFVFVNCTLRNCRVIKCTVLISDDVAKAAALDGANWITVR